MEKKFVMFALVSCLGGLFFASTGGAAFYRYVDKNGVICFADDLQVVPEQYRSQAVIVDAESKDDTVSPANPGRNKPEAAAPDASSVRSESGRPRPLSTRLVISTAVGLSAFLVFAMISNLPALKENKNVLSIIRGSLIGAVLVYLIVAHVKDVKTALGITGQTVEEAQRRSAEKGKKAAQAIKTLDATFEEAQKALESGTGEPREDNK